MKPSDSLIIRGMLFFGRHGVLAEENKLGQRFKVDLDVWSNLSKASQTDDLSDTLNYVRIFEITQNVIEGPPCKLVEKVAGKIADNVLKDLPTADRVRVRVSKPHVAIRGVLDEIGVEIFRDRI